MMVTHFRHLSCESLICETESIFYDPLERESSHKPSPTSRIAREHQSLVVGRSCVGPRGKDGTAEMWPVRASQLVVSESKYSFVGKAIVGQIPSNPPRASCDRIRIRVRL